MDEVVTKLKGIGWVVATFFLTGIIAGTGVLALPAAMLGAGPSEIAIIIFFGVNSAFVGIKLGQCWEMLKQRFPAFNGQIRDPYPAIAEKSTGKTSRMISIIMLNINLYGTGCVYIVLIADFLKNIFDSFDVKITTGMWMVIIAFGLMPLCYLGTPNDFWPLAICAVITTIAACAILIVQLVADSNDPASCFKDKLVFEDVSPSFEGVCKAFSTTMFAFSGASNFPTIQSDMNQSKHFGRSVIVAMSILLLIYVPTASVGYWILGDGLSDNIVQDLCDGNVKIVVEILILLHVISAFPIVINPPNQYAEDLIGIPKEFGWKRVVFRSSVVLCILFVAESIPNFGSILDLVGGSTITPLTFILPPLFYIRLVDASQNKPLLRECPVWTISKYERFYCWFIVGVGVVGSVCSTAVAILNIVSTNFKYPCYIQTCH